MRLIQEPIVIAPNPSAEKSLFMALFDSQYVDMYPTQDPQFIRQDERPTVEHGAGEDSSGRGS